MREGIQNYFEEFKSDPQVKALALTSKNGIPIAHIVEKEGEHESFSTLSATILGASEVIFSSMENDEPGNILVDSDDALLVIKGIDDERVLSLMGDTDDREELLKMIDDIRKTIEEIKEEKEAEL